MSARKHDDGLGMNRCPCKGCKAFRSQRSAKAARKMWSNPRNIRRKELHAQRGQDGLLERFRKEVRAEATEQGIGLTDREIERAAQHRRTNHMHDIRKLQSTQ